MKQKIVMKVQINCQKCQVDAMTVAASVIGITSIALEGENHLAMVGDGVDLHKLTHKLKKKVGYAEIIKLEEIKKK